MQVIFTSINPVSTAFGQWILVSFFDDNRSVGWVKKDATFPVDKRWKQGARLSWVTQHKVPLHGQLNRQMLSF